MTSALLKRVEELDESDPLKHLRNEFIIPSKSDLKRKTLKSDSSDDDNEPCTYLCGNSLGLQPRITSEYISKYLQTWASKGVYGHFKDVSDSPLPPHVYADDAVTGEMSKLVGAQQSEVVVMQTLTVNLHLLLASFYRPTKDRYKIIIEGKAFPSDHYAIISQIQHHGFSADDSMVCIEPTEGALIPTSHILDTITKHAESTALVLLPGVQFYTGQFLDIKTITKHTHSLGILIGWDLAHAAGNVPLQLHDWNVNFAMWCTYKYLNCGPGCAGGLFVHEKHSGVYGKRELPVLDNKNAQMGVPSEDGWKADYERGYINRLSGWWGSKKESRFRMENQFEPITGAAGWQVSNPSVLDLTSVQASLSVFSTTTIAELREKSLRLTGLLEELLIEMRTGEIADCYNLITPAASAERGAQLSLMLKDGLLDPVMEVLEKEGVVVDERHPNVIRVAPAPLYNTFKDVQRFVEVFCEACRKSTQKHSGTGDLGGSLMVEGGKDSKGWSEIK
ncbi:MAG: Kynureninase (L-kynurenine hydrolase) [Bogoriella megaspora]|nr:MAG: Kynureninase (L-kynurenine hydrolase) [Bogoriella megaspora]